MGNWKETFRRLRLLVGPKGATLFLSAIALSFVLAAIEYGLAIFLMVFLYSLGLIGSSGLPAWLPFDVQHVSAPVIWGALLGLGVMQALCLIMQYESKVIFVEGLHARMRTVLAYRLLLARDCRWMPISEMTLCTAEYFPQTALFVFHLIQALSFLVQTGMIALGMLFLAPGEAGVALTGLGVMGLFVLRLNRLTNRFSARMPSAQAELERAKVRIGRNWLLIRVLRIERREFERWVRAAHAYFRHGVLAYLFGHLGGAVMPVLAIVVLAAVVYSGQQVFHTSMANLVAFLYLFMRFQQMVSYGSNMLGGLFAYRTHLARAAEVVFALSDEELRSAVSEDRALSAFRRRPKESGGTVPPGDNGGEARRAPPGIRLRDLSFAWPGQSAPALQGVSLEVERGAQLGIVGPNGSGKSTLLGLLLGVLKPSSGEVIVDGQTAGAYVLAHAAAIAYMGPDPYLIQGSVRENLIYGSDQARTEDELWRALAKVDLDGFFRSVPGGLDYPIQENGDGLSSGQKQRLAMARGFLREPGLFVMDEPSANLDAETEACVLGALREIKGRCTVVIVSHRPGMLKDADRIVSMNAGGVEA